MPIHWRVRHLIAAILTLTLSSTANAVPNHHLVGWTNVLLPGSGRFLMGEPLRGSAELALTGTTFGLGYSGSDSGPFTIDGVPNDIPRFGSTAARGTVEQNITKPMYIEILQEIGLKSHMSFIFLSYRDAAKANGITENIDQSSGTDLFLSPFDTKNLTTPWFYAPLALTAAWAIFDFHQSKNNNLPVVPRLTPYSNFLYTFDYQISQPVGSGAPEEMFYRGFLQNEFYSMVNSPFFSIPLSTAAFAFSHGPGPGRITAAISGLYLGYLAHRNKGDLKQGIAIHFWSSLILGIETVFLAHEAQHTTPPTALNFQINY